MSASPNKDHVSATVAHTESALQQQISAILDDYLTRLETGKSIDDAKFLAKHADLATQLRPHLANLRAMHESLVTAKPGSDLRDESAAAPKRLGNYLLHREIGRGGMGVVYEATDETLGRRVALKALPFAALLDRKQIDRFHNEARAAAQLHHPNIVPVYAVGVDRGVHYYAMQFIEGGPLSAAIEQLAQLKKRETSDKARETTLPKARQAQGRSATDGTRTSYQFRNQSDHCRQVARLGIDMAGALACAHNLSIIHRDIKPSNLLLDENGKAWIADFGLARIPTDIGVTATGDVLGTARYMSPEQAAGHNTYVDHRTDIYSLGITLYELLTLQPAFPTTSRDEFMRQIRSVEPTPPRRLNAEIPVDLETIILTAIAKDPAERYPAADQLAEDLQRFLDGRPTLAKRASLSERGFKWARRHRKAVTVAAAVLLTATVGLATATFMIGSARQQTQTALIESEANFERAQTNFQAAREIVDQLVQTSEQLAPIPGTEQVRRQLLTNTKNYYDFFLTQTEDSDLAWERTVALSKSGTIAERLGDTKAASKLYREAISDLEQLAQQHPGDEQIQRELANCLNNEAMLLARAGDSEAALAQLDAALVKQQALLDRDTDANAILQEVACIQSNRAFLLEQRQQRADSRQAYERAVQLFRQAIEVTDARQQAAPVELQRRLAVTLHNLASLLVDADAARAHQLCQDAIAIQEALVDQHLEVLAFRSDLALSLDNLGGIRVRQDDLPAAEAAYLRAIELEEQLVAIAPSVPGYRQDLAISLNHLGQLLQTRQSYQEAHDVFERAIQLLTGLADSLPDDVAYRSSLGAALYNQGDVLLRLDQRESARQVWEAGLAHQHAAVDQAPHNAQFRSFLTVQQAKFDSTFSKSSQQ